MATSRWRSSLAQAETRIRRSLGIAGPIDLELKPELTPVIITDDATRPGAASQLRGRRWMATFYPGTIAIGDRGSWWLYADGPYGASGQVNPLAGGIIVDRMTVSMSTTGGNVRFTMYAFPTEFVLAPGLPIAVTPNNARFVDPTRGSDTAPVALYGSATVPPETGGGVQIARWRMSNSLNYQQDLEIFLNWNSALAVGVDVLTVPLAALECDVTFHGRIF